ncbi:uracil-DNA glycosylase [Paracoccus sediminilitoris]|uniref:uracil-DNA glycosylase n=1 Tax=Paracoccus sediminilitoris TaxID=2202419 RepID=UPI000DBA71CE|nr:uracil-DNA glycosylase [Paracoccus sediminilitoris]
MQEGKSTNNAEDATGLAIIKSGISPSARHPRSLSDKVEIERRKQMLAMPHMLPLNAFVVDLRRDGRGFVPDFDPLDGGAEARILFLLEKPGPKTDPRKGGSGFVSRDNNDATAEAIFRFMAIAGLRREDTVIWNTVPWWDQTISIKSAAWKEGLEHLHDLTRILPNLRSVVLVGAKAGRAGSFFEEQGYRVWYSAHPSGRVRAAYPALYQAIPKVWKEAANNVGAPTGK